MFTLRRQQRFAGQICCSLRAQQQKQQTQLRTTGAAAATYSTTGTASDAEHYDIIIGGGGLVGATLAAALASNRTLADKRILLLEAAPPFKGFDPLAPYSNRVSAINKHSIELFKSIPGMWEHIAGERVKFVKQMQVWESQSDALIQFQHDGFAQDIACIIENNLILAAAYAQLLDKQYTVQVHNRARIKQVQLPRDTDQSHTVLTLQDGRNFSCDLLVGADGANSVVRKALNVDVFSLNYDSMSLVATLELSEAGDNSVAWQRFLPTGPVALLPLSDKESSLVWSTSKSHARQLLAMSATEFVDALNESFCKQYPKVEIADRALQFMNSLCGIITPQTEHRQYPPRVSGVLDKTRATYPLGLLHASSYVCEGAALIGDAAHRIHPLAGQGLNLGFSDVQLLVKALSTGAYAGAKLGDKQHLLQYEQKCLAKNTPIIAGVHALHTLYSTDIQPVVLLRSLGLQLTQNLPAFKQFLMQRAIG